LISEDEEDDDVLLDNHDLTKNIEIKQKATVTAKGDVLYNGGLETNNMNKFNRVKTQIDDVVDSVRTNISKVLDRGTTLDELNDRSEDLSTSAATFNTRARYTRKALWMRTCRARLYLGGTIFVIVGLLMFFLYRMFKAS
jgi:hypothetical protein